MEVQFLGTSSGTPTKTRNVTAIALQESQGSTWYLIDCGEGTQHQLLHTNLSMNTLGAIFITHIHGDHCYGLPGLLASAGMSGRKEPLTIVAPKGIKEWLESTQLHTELYLPYELVFIPTESLPTVALGQFNVGVLELSHRVPSFAYSFTERKVEASLDINKLVSLGIPQGPLWGQLKSGSDIEHEGERYSSEDFISYKNKQRKMIICGDNDSPELLKVMSHECDVLIHEATYTEDMAKKAKDVGHSYAKLVANFAQENAIPNLLLTHFSPRYQAGASALSSIADIRKEAASVYSKNLYLAEDFEKYTLDKLGCLSKVVSDTEH